MASCFPEFCVWETTLACNLACRHCGSRAGSARPRELGTEEALHLLHELADLGTRELTCSGGEFVLRRDWRTLLERSVALGISSLVVTNGFAITPQVAADFARLGAAGVSVSLDGPEAVHDALRPGPGESFRRIRDAIRNLREAGIPVSIITQVSKANLPHLEELDAILRPMGISSWQIQLTNPMGRAAGKAGVRIVDPCDVPAIHAFIRKVQDAREIRCLAADNVGYFGPEEPLLRSDGRRAARFWAGCQAGMRVVGITSDGGVKGCLSMPDSLLEGNVRESSLREIWERPGAFSYNREFDANSLSGACRDCAFGRLCRAGCHSFTWSLLGRVTENPYCVRQVGPPS